MAASPVPPVVPWCPNCRQPLRPEEIGRYKHASGLPPSGLSLIFCTKCGVILGGMSV